MAASYIEALLPAPYDIDSGPGVDLREFRWNNDEPVGSADSVTFKFLTAVPNHSVGVDSSGFAPFTPEQQAVMRTIVGLYEEICNLNFTEVASGNADLLFGRNSQHPSGYAYSPDLVPSTDPVDGGPGGDIWLSTNAANLDVGIGKAGWNTLMHELGHALGLKHSFTPDGAQPALPPETDTSQYTVMSYNPQSEARWRTVTDLPGGGYQLDYFFIQPSTPMLYDVAAIQYLYGANMTTRAGNDVYTFDPDTPFLKCIWDGGGSDTISVSNFTLGCEIDLRAGQFSSITILPEPLPFGTDTNVLYDGTDNLSIAYGALIENATGGGGNDNLIGNAANNVLDGGAGNDTMVGGAGNDTMVGGAGNDTMAGGAGNDTYMRDATGDVVTEAASAGTDTVQSAVAYTLGANVENLTLTGAAAINGTGNTMDNVLTGNGGNNVLNGNVGNDTMAGGLGNDTYVRNVAGDVVTEGLNAGIDTVQSAVTYTLGANVENLTLTGAGAINGTGNTLANVLRGNGGNNVLNGSTGTDTASYAGVTAAVTVNLGAAGAQNTGGAGTDTLTSIENLTGSNFNDTLTGSSAANVLDGGAGNDTMAGGAGNDTYVRNVVGDVVTEGVNAGTDTVQSAATYTLGLNVENLTLTGAGAINGTGNTLNNVIAGNSGSNVLNGGTGTDTASYASATAGVTVSLGVGGAQNTQGAGVDALTAIENLTGGNFNDMLTGNTANNVLNGGAGADTLNGSDGNDTLVWDAADVSLNGGVGTDTLRIDGAAQTLNLLTVGQAKIQNVEVINVTGSGNNRLELSLQDVLDLSSTTNTLRVDGNAGDTVDRNAGWVQGANQVIGANTYFSYTQGLATLLVDTDITSVT